VKSDLLFLKVDERESVTHYQLRRARMSGAFGKATEGTHLAFIHGFTPVAFCEGG
jgi:hypothetical protein